MRALLLLAAAMLLLPTGLAAVVPPTAIPVPPPLPMGLPVPLPALPLNALANGGFEAGLAGWTSYGTGGALVPGFGGGNGARIAGGPGGHMLRQFVAPVEGPVLLLDFDATIERGPTGPFAIEALVGGAVVVARVDFQGGKLLMNLYEGGQVSTGLPSPGWHHYSLLVVPLPAAPAVGVLFVDGIPLLLNQGAVVGPLAPNNLILGDVGWSTDGAVAYDNLYLGPLVP